MDAICLGFAIVVILYSWYLILWPLFRDQQKIQNKICKKNRRKIFAKKIYKKAWTSLPEKGRDLLCIYCRKFCDRGLSWRRFFLH